MQTPRRPSEASLTHSLTQGSIQETIKPDVIVPVTVLSTREIFGKVDETLRRFDARDDVFVPDFGFVLVEKPGGNSSSAGDGRGLGRRGARHYRLMDGAGDGDAGSARVAKGLAGLPSGPYFLHGPNLYQAWRLYDDEADAFAFGVVPENVTAPTSR